MWRPPWVRRSLVDKISLVSMAFDRPGPTSYNHKMLANRAVCKGGGKIYRYLMEYPYLRSKRKRLNLLCNMKTLSSSRSRTACRIYGHFIRIHLLTRFLSSVYPIKCTSRVSQSEDFGEKISWSNKHVLTRKLFPEPSCHSSWHNWFITSAQIVGLVPISSAATTRELSVIRL